MDSQQFNVNNVEALKAARRQVIPDENMVPQSAPGIQEIQENPPPKIKEEGFVEGLLHKLQVLAVAEETLKREKEQFDKIWASLEEKRQKLETRLTAINRIKGKLMALNTEVEDIIS